MLLRLETEEGDRESGPWKTRENRVHTGEEEWEEEEKQAEEEERKRTSSVVVRVVLCARRGGRGWRGCQREERGWMAL